MKRNFTFIVLGLMTLSSCATFSKLSQSPSHQTFSDGIYEPAEERRISVVSREDNEAIESLSYQTKKTYKYTSKKSVPDTLILDPSLTNFTLNINTTPYYSWYAPYSIYGDYWRRYWGWHYYDPWYYDYWRWRDPFYFGIGFDPFFDDFRFGFGYRFGCFSIGYTFSPWHHHYGPGYWPGYYHPVHHIPAHYVTSGRVVNYGTSRSEMFSRNEGRSYSSHRSSSDIVNTHRTGMGTESSVRRGSSNQSMPSVRRSGGMSSSGSVSSEGRSYSSSRSSGYSSSSSERSSSRSYQSPSSSSSYSSGRSYSGGGGGGGFSGGGSSGGGGGGGHRR